MFTGIADKIFIINLKERLDRKSAIIQELSSIGLDSSDYCFFEAIKPEDKGEFRSKGAKGCFMSHLGVLKEAQRQGLHNVVIIEDDLAFRHIAIKNQVKIAQELVDSCENFDILYLGHGESDQKTGILTIPYNRPILLAHFVFFNQRTIPDLIKFLEGLIDPHTLNKKWGPMDVDGAYTTYRLEKKDSVKTGLFYPNLAFQRPSNSDITGTNLKVSPIVSILRSLKLFIKRYL